MNRMIFLIVLVFLFTISASQSSKIKRTTEDCNNQPKTSETVVHHKDGSTTLSFSNEWSSHFHFPSNQNQDEMDHQVSSFLNSMSQEEGSPDSFVSKSVIHSPDSFVSHSPVKHEKPISTFPKPLRKQHRNRKQPQPIHDPSSSSSTSSFHSTEYITNPPYIINTSSATRNNNMGPFQPVSIQWNSPSSPPASLHSSVFPRPVSSDLCNHRFPFQPIALPFLSSDHHDQRFSNSTIPNSQLSQLQKTILSLHNQERIKYKLPLLSYNLELEHFASCWSELKRYGHSDYHFLPTGENIAQGVGEPCYENLEKAVISSIDSFLDEDIEFAKSHECDDNSGHWCQIVWKQTKFVGCGITPHSNFDLEIKGKLTYYLVCSYFPAGNIIGKESENVPKPINLRLRNKCSIGEIHT